MLINYRCKEIKPFIDHTLSTQNKHTNLYQLNSRKFIILNYVWLEHIFFVVVSFVGLSLFRFSSSFYFYTLFSLSTHKSFQISQLIRCTNWKINEEKEKIMKSLIFNNKLSVIRLPCWNEWNIGLNIPIWVANAMPCSYQWPWLCCKSAHHI